jgi:DNA-binding FrmR family transcriptional regulator
MRKPTTHEGQLAFLKKIEGQVRGIQKMIADGRYCVDIITQVHSAIGALYRVEDNIFKKHLDTCVAHALKGKSDKEKQAKIDEIMELIARFRKTV